MASSRLKGITVVIDGNTTKLQDALKGVDRQVYSLNGDLKALNQALKLDPTNINTLSQKQDVLKRNIEATTERLNTLKEAQKQMGSYKHLTDEQKDSYNQLSLEIAKAEEALKGMKNQLQVLPGLSVENLKNGLKQVGDIALEVSKKVMQLSAALGGALVAGITASVKSYAELEKAQRGSERLFGESFSIVKNNAATAYKSMGLSASEYYDQVNTYAVGLSQSLKGDTKRAAQLSNDILVAQADIVAATGASQDQVQSAFAAVMRGNFTMIDNLRLGVKGSRQGMQEVIQKVNEWNKAQGNATHYQMDNYADMQQALVDYTKMVGVAGTAQKQMSETISGSFSQMKSAFTNLLSGVGSASDLSSTIKTFMNNIFKAVEKLAPSLLKGLVSVFEDVIPRLFSMTGELLPIIIDGVNGIIDSLNKFINDDAEQFRKIAVDILKNIVNFITRNLPIILQAAIKIITELAIGIGQAAPELMPAIVDALVLMVETLIDNIDLIIDAGIQLIEGLIKGIIIAVPRLVQKMPEIITKLVDALKAGISKIVDIGKNLVEGLWEGIKSMGDWLWTKLKGFGESVLGFLGDIFGIASPSKKMRWQGQMLGEGLALGIEDTMPMVENAMSNLSSGVEASVNPTINPTANTNPLILNIDKFYNNRETDVQQLAEELEFYRRNSALAKGGV